MNIMGMPYKALYEPIITVHAWRQSTILISIFHQFMHTLLNQRQDEDHSCHCGDLLFLCCGYVAIIGLHYQARRPGQLYYQVGNSHSGPNWVLQWMWQLTYLILSRLCRWKWSGYSPSRYIASYRIMKVTSFSVAIFKLVHRNKRRFSVDDCWVTFQLDACSIIVLIFCSEA